MLPGSDFSPVYLVVEKLQEPAHMHYLAWGDVEWVKRDYAMRWDVLSEMCKTSPAACVKPPGAIRYK